jgi:acetyl/propionyl-CoA carboxylase alpha subunit
MIRRLLIANRGEIARRVTRTCRALGVETVAVYSEADQHAPHVEEADRRELIGPAPAAQSYLNIDRLMDAVHRSGADALHPGYGFLSENPALAEACEKTGIVFVGPPSTVMRRLGTKMGARRVAEDAGVPVVPGLSPASQSQRDIEAAAHAIGWPVLLKAAAGGGGKGMRPVRSAGELPALLAAARQEALRAFGSDVLYVERLVDKARHVEVQLFGDTHGAVVHLFERDCSLQRRHQKVIEETPAPGLSPAVRKRLTEAAVAIGRAVGYVGAGTAEFLLEGEGDSARFFFLELNMRLQVEHPVTEAVTGLDLVALQLRVASGEPLPFSQADVRTTGHAMECRVYAEDARTLLPQSGRLLRYREPHGTGLRVDSGVIEGTEIPVHYDPLLAKVISAGATREDARTRLLGGLRTFDILGVRHNIGLLLALLAHPRVAAGPSYTTFIEDELPTLASDPDERLQTAAAALAAVAALGPDAAPAAERNQPAASRDPWDRVTSFGI